MISYEKFYNKMNGQTVTKNSYEDPDVVANYIKEHLNAPEKIGAYVNKYHKWLKGNKIIDIGCGPGINAYLFAQLGFDVTAIDYSNEMINSAINLENEFPNLIKNPEFKIVDMKNLDKEFTYDSFDSAWCSASLLHIHEDEMSGVLKQIYNIVKNSGNVFISLKGGKQGTRIIKENKYIDDLVREFTFWEKENFVKIAQDSGFECIDIIEDVNGLTEGKPTSWLQFHLLVNK
jgi:SAM-dependent methyltransferase